MKRSWLLGVLLGGLAALPAQAQRPFRVYDPFYRNETARRTFDDDLALSGEVSYTATRGGTGATQPDPVELGIRLDYRLTPHLEVGAVVDASGTASGRNLRWGWILGRYGWTVGANDYAFRLALDPDSDGRVGFPQADLAFVATSPIGPGASSDFAVGVRRVRRGYRQVGTGEIQPPATVAQDTVGRALGWEVHLMVAYSAFLSPSGSRVFASLSVERGDYELVGLTDPGNEPLPTRYFRGGLVWLRPGVEFARPNFRFAPFLGLPVVQWSPDDQDIPRIWPQVGVELTLR